MFFLRIKIPVWSLNEPHIHQLQHSDTGINYASINVALIYWKWLMNSWLQQRCSPAALTVQLSLRARITKAQMFQTEFASLEMCKQWEAVITMQVELAVLGVWGFLQIAFGNIADFNSVVVFTTHCKGIYFFGWQTALGSPHTIKHYL